MHLPTTWRVFSNATCWIHGCTTPELLSIAIAHASGLMPCAPHNVNITKHWNTGLGAWAVKLVFPTRKFCSRFLQKWFVEKKKPPSTLSTSIPPTLMAYSGEVSFFKHKYKKLAFHAMRRVLQNLEEVFATPAFTSIKNSLQPILDSVTIRAHDAIGFTYI